jgi:hypothetical protein
MKGLCFILSLGLCLVFSGMGIGQEPKPDFREDLKTAIPEGIRMLEAKEYVAFLKAFVPPELLKKIVGDGKIEEFAEKFGKGKSATLLKVLSQVKDAEPEYNEDKTKALYKLKEVVDGKSKIEFSKQEKYWYIEN